MNNMCQCCFKCMHFGCQGHEGYGRCNKIVHVDDYYLLYEFAWQKQNNIACNDYWDSADGILWKDRFGYVYEYCWLKNRFECKQTGKYLPAVYKEILIPIK